MIWDTWVCLPFVMFAKEVTSVLSALALLLESSTCAVFCSW